MSDLISRQEALDTLSAFVDLDEYYHGRKCENIPMLNVKRYLENAPSAEPEPEEFEWCHDCKEYDQEKHCCHRWTKVIRQTVKEVKAQYALEYPKIIHCKDCKFYTPMNRELKTGICSLTMHHLGDEGFCSDADMRGDQ